MPSALEWALLASLVKIKTLEYYTTISIFERVQEPEKGKADAQFLSGSRYLPAPDCSL
jgi:hypothetical protein